eukprot:2814879-Rhodomonas_salina.1
MKVAAVYSTLLEVMSNSRGGGGVYAENMPGGGGNGSDIRGHHLPEAPTPAEIKKWRENREDQIREEEETRKKSEKRKKSGKGGSLGMGRGRG